VRKAAELVDELGAIEKEMAAAEAEVAKKLGTKPERAAELRAQIVALYEDAPAAIPFSAEGARFVAMLSARANVTEVSVDNVFKVLKRAEFLGMCTLPVGKLRLVLDAAQLAKCTRTLRTGARSLSVAQRGNTA